MTRPAPSVRVDKKDSPPWLPWLLGLLLLAVLAAVLWFLFAGDDEDAELPAEDSVSQGLEEDAEEPEAVIEPDTDTDTETETETEATDQALEPLVLTPPFDALSGQAGQPVTASDVEVVDVPADEAFTIGTAEDELLVHITPEARAAGGSESAVNVQPGSVVTSLEGTLEPITDELISMLQLQGDEADALQEREFYVAATAFELAAA